MGEEISPSYHAFFFHLIITVATIVGYYFVSIGLALNAYVGNKTMISAGSLWITYAALAAVLHLGWFISYGVMINSHLAKKGGSTRKWVLMLRNIRSTFEYNMVFWSWILHLIGMVLAQNIALGWIVIGEVGFGGSVKVGDKSAFIGSSGTLGIADDILQLGSLVTIVVGVIATTNFIYLNKIIFFHGAKTN